MPESRTFLGFQGRWTLPIGASTASTELTPKVGRRTSNLDVVLPAVTSNPHTHAHPSRPSTASRQTLVHFPLNLWKSLPKRNSSLLPDIASRTNPFSFTFHLVRILVHHSFSLLLSSDFGGFRSHSIPPRFYSAAQRTRRRLLAVQFINIQSPITNPRFAREASPSYWLQTKKISSFSVSPACPSLFLC